MTDKAGAMKWQPIETYHKPTYGSGPMVALANFYQVDEEDGECTEFVLRWHAIGCWFNGGWKARSGSQLGVSPGNDWLALKEPTHWSPIPDDLK